MSILWFTSSQLYSYGRIFSSIHSGTGVFLSVFRLWKHRDYTAKISSYSLFFQKFPLPSLACEKGTFLQACIRHYGRALFKMSFIWDNKTCIVYHRIYCQNWKMYDSKNIYHHWNIFSSYNFSGNIPIIFYFKVYGYNITFLYLIEFII